MSDLIYYERNLPHQLPPGEAIFITFRLADSLPHEVLGRLRGEAALVQNGKELDAVQLYAEQRRYFGRFDDLLDRAVQGPMWLRQPEVAALVAQALHYANGKSYDLLAYCLMPNHVHVLLHLPPGAPPLVRTLQRLKGYTALQANRLLGRTGAFWQAESYDHVAREGELPRIISYIVNNPVKANLVADWQQWPHTYVKEGLQRGLCSPRARFVLAINR